jgi:putative lipoic acid-binding regulatory protein
MKDKENFYQKLKLQLDETTKFPSDYLYKFIVPTSENRVAQVRQIFENSALSISIKKSKTGKYNSISIVINLENSNEVISYYKQAEKIEGIISL